MSFVYFQVYYGNIFKRFLYSKTTHYINNKGNYAGKYVWLIIKVESFWENQFTLQLNVKKCPLMTVKRLPMCAAYIYVINEYIGN